jgi:hypothetical protein
MAVFGNVFLSFIISARIDPSTPIASPHLASAIHPWYKTINSINDIWEGFVKARNENTHAARREMNRLWMVSTNGKRPGNEGVLKEMLLQPDEAPSMPLQPRRPPTRGRPEEDTTQRGDFSKRPPRPASPAQPASHRGGASGSAIPARQASPVILSSNSAFVLL